MFNRRLRMLMEPGVKQVGCPSDISKTFFRHLCCPELFRSTWEWFIVRWCVQNTSLSVSRRPSERLSKISVPDIMFLSRGKPRTGPAPLSRPSARRLLFLSAGAIAKRGLCVSLRYYTRRRKYDACQEALSPLNKYVRRSSHGGHVYSSVVANVASDH